jgi:ribosomal protein S25
MFGFSKEVLLKRELLLFLDQQEEYVTSEMLAIQMKTVTSQTIRKVLKDLSALIASLYNQEQLNLHISTKYGVKLTRKGANFTPVFEKLYSEDLVYGIFRELMLSRFFSTEDFCQQQQISVSKARRVIRQINEFLIPYECVLKVGRKVSITGKESQSRLHFFMFFYYVHRKISQVEWIEKETYLMLSRSVCQAFYLTPAKQNIEVLALWLFINLHSQSLGKELEITFDKQAYMLELPQSDCSQSDWTYFLFVMYSLDFINFEPQLTFEILHQKEIEEVINEWIALFEQHVHVLNKNEKKQLYIKRYKRLLLEKMIPLKDIYTIFKLSSQVRSETNNPYAASVFNHLWRLFIRKFPHLSTELNRRYFLDTCFYFGSSESLVAPVYCRWHSSLSVERLQQMEKIIQHDLMKLAKVTFVESHDSAVVISTESPQAGILIDPMLSKRDLTFLKEEIKKRIQITHIISSS